MRLLYNIIIELAAVIVRPFSGLNKKIQQGQLGRNESLQILKQAVLESDKVIWLHCASLGEYEQGLPVF